MFFFFFSSRRRHTRLTCDWSSDVCSSDLVGRLQRNKVRHLVGWVDLIHSLDRPELAVEIGNRAAATGATQEALAEVNVSGDRGRGGVMPEDLASLLESAASVPGVRVTGLMAMAPIVGSPEDARPYFRRVARLRDAA